MHFIDTPTSVISPKQHTHDEDSSSSRLPATSSISTTECRTNQRSGKQARSFADPMCCKRLSLIFHLEARRVRIGWVGYSNANAIRLDLGVRTDNSETMNAWNPSVLNKLRCAIPCCTVCRYSLQGKTGKYQRRKARCLWQESFWATNFKGSTKFACRRLSRMVELRMREHPLLCVGTDRHIYVGKCCKLKWPATQNTLSHTTLSLVHRIISTP